MSGVPSGAQSLSSAELAGVAETMAAAGAPPAGPLEAALIAGGRSNLTFRLDDGATSWVLRTPPRAGRTPSAHDVAREFRVTRALAATEVPVPPAVVLCEDESVLGGPFAVAEFVAGRAVQSRTDLDDLDDAALQTVTARLLRVLASLHAVDHVAVGLERFGRPDAYAARQLKRWSGQWDIVAPEDAPGAEAVRRDGARLARELGERNPAQRSTGIVHGDFRIDNTLLLLDEGEPRVAAVVDWELCTIGDPVADVAMMCAYRDPAFDLIVGAPSAWTSPRLPDLSGLAAGYESAGGVPLVDWEFHLALACFKVGVIAAGIDHRHRAGAGSGAGFDTAGESVAAYFSRGLSALACR